MTLCNQCRKSIPIVASRVRRVNEALHQLGLRYYESLPTVEIDQILTDNGFNPTGNWSNIHNDNLRHEEVGEGKWILINWHRMPSGRYEVVSYVN